MSAWPAKTRRAPSGHARDARVHGQTTTVMREMSAPAPPPPIWARLIGQVLLRTADSHLHPGWRVCFWRFRCTTPCVVWSGRRTGRWIRRCTTSWRLRTRYVIHPPLQGFALNPCVVCTHVLGTSIPGFFCSFVSWQDFTLG